MAAKAKAKTASSSSSKSKGDSRKLYDAGGTPGVHVDSNVTAFLEGGAGAPTVGSFAKVTKGKNQGRYGVFRQVSKFDKNGWPEEVVFETRDADSERLVVKYSELESAEPGLR